VRRKLTQLYALKPLPALHRLDLSWFHYVRAAGPVFGNLFAFRK